MMTRSDALPLWLLLPALACGSLTKESNGPRPESAPERVMSIPVAAPLVVPGSTRIAPGEHVRPPLAAGRDGAEAGEGGVIVLRGLNGAVLDLTGVDLRGTAPGTDLDRNSGVGIRVEDCEDVTIRGGRLGGYKVCLLVRSSRGVVVEDVAFEGWYGQRLRSTAQAEHEDDWIYPHENDNGEWNRTYGAAISFSDCSSIVVRRCRGRRGQNGILLTRTDDSRIYDNDFSFLSGWGLGMYRSSRNVVSHNIFDYCIRGFSHGVYSRGQDSAGILMFERCCDNVVAYNSATHGGDGVFLYGGQDTVEGRAFERGELDAGGGDRNIFYKNDLRFAAANALEATFSTGNVAIENDLSGCNQHGVWGGYSSEMIVWGNRIDDTAGGGVTIEHGQRCLIARNSFRNDYVAVELYWDEDPQFVDGPYGRHRETSSSDHWIVENTFLDNDQDLVILETTGLSVLRNRSSGQNRLLDDSGGLSAASGAEVELETLRRWLRGDDGSRPSGRLARCSLRGPMVAEHPRMEELKRFRPPSVPGEQKTSALERGEVGGLETIVMGTWGPWDFRSGEPRPAQRRAGGLLADARWAARWFRWQPESEDPRADLARWRALAAKPLVERVVDNFHGPFADALLREQVGQNHFGLVATTRLRIREGGRHRLTVESDDGVRVSVDGRVVIEDWTYHAARTRAADLTLGEGMHELAIEYFQIQGATALALALDPWVD